MHRISHSTKLIVGDCRSILRTLPDQSVHCCITSPPYYNLRDYEHPDQIGQEESPEDYVQELVGVFREVRRVLRNDGTLWLNLGDSYSSKTQYGLKKKDLIGIPWMVAFALRSDGWFLRSDIIWEKPNPAPSSILDRPTSSHEYVFLLTKTGDYFYDSTAIRDYSRSDTGRNRRTVWTISSSPSFRSPHFAVFPEDLCSLMIKAGTSEKGCCGSCKAPILRLVDRVSMVNVETSRSKRLKEVSKRNALSGQMDRAPDVRTVGWTTTCDCELSITVPCLVLDPFSGSGTTLLEAQRLGRRGLGIEISSAFADMAEQRIKDHRSSTMKPLSQTLFGR
jgi:DNA modification methylase